MFAVCDDSGVWWYSECEATTEEPADGSTQENAEASHAASSSAVLVLSSLLPSSGVTKEESAHTPSPIRASKDTLSWDSEALYELDWSKGLEIGTEEQPTSHKILILKETFSSSVGAILCGPDPQATRTRLVRWLRGFGLRSEPVSVQLVTDSEQAVSSLVTSVSDQYLFTVKRAAPQSHESAGHAERAVRLIKEGIKTVILDCERQFGLALLCEPFTLQMLLNYVCFAHNNFAAVQDSKRSPREIALGEKCKTDAFSLFGSKVLAEVPDSLRNSNPSLPRFVPASFLHPQFESVGSLVVAKIRIGVEMVRRVFVAKSLKLCLPLTVVNDCGLFVNLVDERSGLPIGPSASEPVNMLPEAEGQDLVKSTTGPPLKWVEEHEVTPGCSACKAIEIYGTRQGQNHSKACCARYWNWMKEQAVEPPKNPDKVPGLGLKDVPPPEEEDNYEPDLDPPPNPSGSAQIVPVNTSSSYRPDFGDNGLDILGLESPPETGLKRDGDAPEGSDLKKFRAEEVVVKEELDSPMEGSTDGLQVDTEYARVTSTKRSSDTPLEQLELQPQEINQERSRRRLSLCLADVEDLSFMATDSDEPVRVAGVLDLVLGVSDFRRDALGPAWSRVAPRLFCVAAWHLAHLPSLCVAGVALGEMDLHVLWQGWHLRHWAGLGDALGRAWSRVTPRLFCVAGVARGDICLRFVWQAWRLVTWTFTLCGRRATCGTGQALVTRLGLWRRLFCVAGVALGDIPSFCMAW
eukprot:s1874_g8.t1